MAKQHSLLIINEIDKELKRTISPKNYVSPAHQTEKENQLKKYSLRSPNYNRTTVPNAEKQENTLSLTLSPQAKYNDKTEQAKYNDKTEESTSDVLYNKITSRIKKMIDDVDTKCADISNKISAIINSSP